MKNLIFVLIFFLFTGCTRYLISIESSGDDSNILDKTCYIYSEDTVGNIYKNDMPFHECYTYVKNILINKGYNVVKSVKEANIIVFFDIGNDINSFEYARSLPIYGQTGVSSSTTYGNAYINPNSNSINFDATTYYHPQYGVVGSRTVQEYGSDLFMTLNIQAFDLDFNRIDFNARTYNDPLYGLNIQKTPGVEMNHFLRNKYKMIWQISMYSMEEPTLLTEIVNPYNSYTYNNRLSVAIPMMTFVAKDYVGVSSEFKTKKMHRINSAYKKYKKQSTMQK